MSRAEWVMPGERDQPARCVACGARFGSDVLLFEHRVLEVDPKTGKKRKRCMSTAELGAQLHQDRRGEWTYKY